MKRKSQPSKNGFTLIETLVSLGILGLLVVVVTALFFSLLRGASKTKAIQTVKQNGGYAISVMERMIRNAKQVLDCQTDYIKIKSQDEEETTFRFYSDSEEDDSWIASVSGTLTCADARLTSSEVQLVSSSFTCMPGGGTKPDGVDINFSLAKTGTGTRPEEGAVVNFQTSVFLRNY